MFWQSGWNFVAGWLDSPLGQRLALILPLYLLSQLLLLFIYVIQDRLYEFLLKLQSKLVAHIILQLHSFFTVANYIVQWVALWTLLDRYTSDDNLIMVLTSIIAILAIIVLTGHLCDLVCSPFLLSYDSIDYTVRIGTSFITDTMNQYLAHILNYLFYELVISWLTIFAWRGVYGFLDVYLYPNNENLSAGISLLIGYCLFFLLMYTQVLQNEMNFIPRFFYSNYPSFAQNLRHLGAFFSCVTLWRGFWILFDLHIATTSWAEASPYVFYAICMLLSFLILSVLKTASSLNGPMSYVEDEYNLFPLYPNSLLMEWFSKKKASNKVSAVSNEITISEPVIITVF